MDGEKHARYREWCAFNPRACALPAYRELPEQAVVAARIVAQRQAFVRVALTASQRRPVRS